MASTSKRGSGSTTPRSYESTLAPGEQTALLNHEGESDFGLNYHTQAASNGDTSQPGELSMHGVENMDVANRYNATSACM